jgi:NtrC-family two-component system response regulator AlgB
MLAAEAIMPGPERPPSLAVLVVDDELNIRKALTVALETEGHRVAAVSNSRDAVEEARRRSYDLAMVDLRLGAENGMDLIPALLAESPWMQVVVITAYASIETAVEAMRRGAADYLAKPFTPAQVSLVTAKVARVRSLEERLQGLQAAMGEAEGAVDLRGSSPGMERTIELARQVAASDATVLITGESGTGKGLIARAIHSWSPRKDKPLAIVACPSLSAELLESELFGHVKGAFTGALRDSPGRIAPAEGGALFLDEIGELPPSIQPKLLRLCQEREYERVGDSFTRHADVRIIAATNADLEGAVRSGKFREDLFYRLNVFRIDVPPLRERGEDIAPLAERLLASLRGHKKILGLTPEALEAFRSYRWPGNVRELRNVLERAAILCQGDRIGVEHLPSGFSRPTATPELGDPISLDRIEELHIRRVLASSRSLEDAATVLGIDPATLWRKRKKYGI